MDIKVDNLPSVYSCNICNKNLSCYKSLWRHNKNLHIDKVSKTSDKVLKTSDKVLKTSDKVLKTSDKVLNYNCRYCNNQYNNLKTRWSHEQKCK